MHIVVGIIGIICGALLVKFRQRVGDEFGEQEWAYRIGGVYNVVIIVGIFIIFWSISFMVGTMDFLFWPLLAILPFQKPQKPDDMEINMLLLQNAKTLMSMASVLL